MKNEFDAVKGALSKPAKPKSGKAKVREIHLRKGHKGGYIAKHVIHDEEGFRQGEHEYPMMTRADVHKHIDEHFPEEAAEVAQGDKE